MCNLQNIWAKGRMKCCNFMVWQHTMLQFLSHPWLLDCTLSDQVIDWLVCFWSITYLDLNYMFTHAAYVAMVVTSKSSFHKLMINRQHCIAPALVWLELYVCSRYPISTFFDMERTLLTALKLLNPALHLSFPYQLMPHCQPVGRLNISPNSNQQHGFPYTHWEMNGWNVKITGLKGKIIFDSKPQFWGSMLFFQGVVTSWSWHCLYFGRYTPWN